jgi:glycerol kinase
MTKFVLAIDAGTTNVVAMILDQAGDVTATASKNLELHHPAPGLVEMNPEQLWQNTLHVIKTVLTETGISPTDLAALGVTGQRATICLWDRKTGEPQGPAVVWQDQRGQQRATQLGEAGFITANVLAAASKLEQVIAALPDGTARVQRAALAWGNVDSYLTWRLSGGAVHVTDASNAAATGYFDYFNDWTWFEDLLELQNLPHAFFPQVVDSTGIAGYTDPDVLGARIPIGAIIGDQQAALYGQACLNPGQAKVTYGTSGTCDVNSGSEIKLAQGAYPSVAWTRNGEPTYLVEGMVITAGAVFGWLTQLGILTDPSEAQSRAMEVSDAQGVSFLPGLQGLGTPHNRTDRFGAFEGLTLGTSKSHLARAALEGVAFRVREMVDRVYQDSQLPRPYTLRVDGGASENDLLMQIQANVLGCAIERMAPTEATAWGTALLAGEACGLWEPGSATTLRRVEHVFEPQWSDATREERFHGWKAAFDL